MLNKVTLIGNLGRDPEIRHFEGGSRVTKFTMATNESYKDKAGEWQNMTEWHDIVCWGAQADRAERQLKKGHLAYVEGKITTRKWQDKDGNDRYSTEIVSAYFRSLEKRETTGGNFPTVNDQLPSSGDLQTPQVIETPMQPQQTAPVAQSIPEEDDLPF